MSKPTATPLRIGTAVLAEDLCTTPSRPRQREITWVQRPQPTRNTQDEPSVEEESR